MNTPMPGQAQPLGPSTNLRTMDLGWATERFGFPEHPKAGDKHIANDGGEWTYSLTGTPWWELSQYPPTEPSVDDVLAAAQAVKDREMADMFIQSSICRYCGAHVAIPEAHKAFHDHIEDWMKGVMKAFEGAGFETREQRAARRRIKSATPKDGDDRA